VVQLVAVDLVFSLGSILTAIGMAEHLKVMIAAVVIAWLSCMRRPTPLAPSSLRIPRPRCWPSLLVLIGVALIADGFEFHIPRGYIYFAMGVCRHGGSLQYHGTAQPTAAATQLTLDRQTLLEDIAIAGRFGACGLK